MLKELYIKTHRQRWLWFSCRRLMISIKDHDRASFNRRNERDINRRYRMKNCVRAILNVFPCGVWLNSDVLKVC